MKVLFLLLTTSIIFFSCDKKETTKLEVFSTEAFAYDIGGSWEVNATTRVKGFALNEVEKKFTVTIAYDVDLLTPAGDTVKALISKVEDKSETEKIIEVPIEIQFDLDSTYAVGEYKIIFNIKDAATEQTAVSTATFQLTKE